MMLFRVVRGLLLQHVNDLAKKWFSNLFCV
jgi:hypothetical protein